MEDLNDHSTSALEPVKTVPERSRFLSAIGFPGSVAEPVGVSAEAVPVEANGEAAGVEGEVLTTPQESAPAVVASPLAEASGSVLELAKAAKAVAAEVLDDTKAWSWRGGDESVKPGEGIPSRDSLVVSPLGEGRSEVKPFTPLDGPEPEEEPESAGIDAEIEAESDVEEAASDEGVALLADLGPDFMASRDAMESLEDELLAGFEDDEDHFSSGRKLDFGGPTPAPAEEIEVIEPEAERAESIVEVAAKVEPESPAPVAAAPATPAFPWLTPRKSPGWSAEAIAEKREPQAALVEIEPAAKVEIEVTKVAAEVAVPEEVETEVVAEKVSDDEPAKATAPVIPVSGFSLEDFRNKLAQNAGADEGKATSAPKDEPIFTRPTAEPVAALPIVETKPVEAPVEMAAQPMDEAKPVEVTAPVEKAGANPSPWGDFSWAPKGSSSVAEGSENSLLDDDALLLPDDDEILGRGFGETLASMSNLAAKPDAPESAAAPIEPQTPVTQETPAWAPPTNVEAPAWAPPAVAEAPAWAPPVTAEPTPAKSEPIFASGDVGMVDLSCPSCHRGLSLKQEHLGIAGHCVWCQTPIVAATTGATGQVAVFAIGNSQVIEALTPAATAPAVSDDPGSANWPWGTEPAGAESPAADEDSAGSGATTGFAEPTTPSVTGSEASPWMTSPAEAAPVALGSAPDPFSPPIEVAGSQAAATEKPSAFEWNPAAPSVDTKAVESLEKPAAFSPFGAVPSMDLAAPGAEDPFAPFESPSAAPKGEAVSFGPDSLKPSAFEMGGSIEKLSEFLSHESEPEMSAPLPLSSGLWANPFPSTGKDGLKPAATTEPGDSVPVESGATDLASLAGSERAEALSQTLWPKGAGADQPVSGLAGSSFQPPQAEPEKAPEKAEPAAAVSEAPAVSEKPAKPVKPPKVRKEKAPKAQKAPKPARDGSRKRKLGLKVFGIIALLGLIAGGGATALFWNDIQTRVWPRVEPLIRKYLPAKVVVPTVETVSPEVADLPGPQAVPKATSANPTPAPEPNAAKSPFDKKPLRIQDSPISPAADTQSPSPPRN